MEVKLAQKSDEEAGAAKFYLGIEDWTEQGIKLKINFTTPLSLSKGRNQDALIIKVKNPSMFVSKDTGTVMEADPGNVSLA